MNRKTLRSAALLALTAAALTGCAGGPDRASYEKVRYDMTPELLTIDQRPVDYNNMMGITINTNKRLFWDDLARAMLLDRPSRLSNRLIPY
ncbi:MAG: hypothetical protein AB7Q00_02970 [Phycisphaerales bacterium]|nr:MAG: hypothetical protein IPK69_07615 [Phycisphaerales bacterium]